MTDLLARGSAWLEAERTEHLSRPVTYDRGGESVQVQATVGRTVFRTESADGLLERHEARDYLVLAADLVLGGGAAVLPQAGDRIREADGETVFVYEVMAPGGEPPWRYSDPYRKTLRIHTKHVAMEALP